MNTEGYAVTCTKCGSRNIEIDYLKTTCESKTNEFKTPAKCGDCGFESTK